MFNKFFSTYLQTEPLPIITDDYKVIMEEYNDFLQTGDPTVYNLHDLIQFKDTDLKIQDLGIKTEPLLNPITSKTNIKLNGELDVGLEVVNTAKLFIGTKYSWGGMSPSTGFDCSGLIKYAYKLSGINLPRTAKEMASVGTEVSLDNVKVGDIICTSSTGPSGNHVKMISRIENGLIYTIEAKGKKDGILESPLTKTSNITSIRRIVGNKPSTLFDTKKDYVKTMYNYLYLALENNGIDGNTWAPILTAHTSIESNWGNSFSRRTNNFAGIKGLGSRLVSTREWSPSRGYYTIKSSFKSYPSIEAFADDYVKRLKNRFNAFQGSPSDYLRNIRSKGYFTADLATYQRSLNSRLRDVNNLLNS